MRGMSTHWHIFATWRDWLEITGHAYHLKVFTDQKKTERILPRTYFKSSIKTIWIRFIWINFISCCSSHFYRWFKELIKCVFLQINILVKSTDMENLDDCLYRRQMFRKLLLFYLAMLWTKRTFRVVFLLFVLRMKTLSVCTWTTWTILLEGMWNIKRLRSRTQGGETFKGGDEIHFLQKNIY